MVKRRQRGRAGWFAIYVVNNRDFKPYDDFIFSRKAINGNNFLLDCTVLFLFCFVLFAIFILHSRESELYRYTLDGKSALAWELPFSRFMGHLSST